MMHQHWLCVQAQECSKTFLLKGGEDEHLSGVKSTKVNFLHPTMTERPYLSAPTGSTRLASVTDGSEVRNLAGAETAVR